MIVSSMQQILNFGIAALIGAALGVLYDVFKVLRLVGINSRIAAFFEDILFFLIATVTMFSYYMQITDGKFRIYPLIAAVIGFAIYFLTVEKLVFFVVKTVYNLLCKLFSFIYNKIVLFLFKKLASAIKWLFRPIGKFFKRFFTQNILFFFKNLLPKKRKMLYNNKKVSKMGKGKLRRAKREQHAEKKAFFC